MAEITTTLEALPPTTDTVKSSGITTVATKEDEMNYCYTVLSKIFVLSLGKNAHFSNARYMGDYSMTLEQAQEAKCKYVSEHLGLGPGKRVIDLGCGWGGWLRYVKDKTGAEGIGVTLAKGQADHCVETGLNVKVMDLREVRPETFGTFDAATAFGSFDHLCSYEEFAAGKMHEVYVNYFRNVASLIPIGGYFYMQTMTFGKKILTCPRETWDINAPKDSDAYIMALLVKMFPQSWVPYLYHDVLAASKEYFECEDMTSGRLDYVVTNREWTKRYNKFSFAKYWQFAKLIPTYIRNKEFRYQLDMLRYYPNRQAFERELFDHYRFLFRRIK